MRGARERLYAAPPPPPPPPPRVIEETTFFLASENRAAPLPHVSQLLQAIVPTPGSRNFCIGRMMMMIVKINRGDTHYKYGGTHGHDRWEIGGRARARTQQPAARAACLVAHKILFYSSLFREQWIQANSSSSSSTGKDYHHELLHLPLGMMQQDRTTTLLRLCSYGGERATDHRTSFFFSPRSPRTRARQ